MDPARFPEDQEDPSVPPTPAHRQRARRRVAPHLACSLIACTAFTAALAATPALRPSPSHPPPAHHDELPQVDDLATLVDMAWARSPQARQLEGQGLEARTQADSARGWFPGAPSVTVGQRTGERPGQRALREQEVALAAPLWSPRQRAASQQAADSSQAAVDAATLTLRLELTRQVRERIDALSLGGLMVRQAQSHAEALARLEAEVRQRVAAGDLARVDALLVRQEALAALSEVRRARLAVLEAEHAFHVLVGEVRPAPQAARMGLPDPSRLSDADLQRLLETAHEVVVAHPRLRAAEAARQQQAHRVSWLAQSSRSPWELGLAHRREQDGDARRTNASWGLSLKVPLADEPLQRQTLAVAQTAADVAAAEVRRTHDVLVSDLLEAVQAVRHQRALLADARESTEAAQARADLIRRAHALGEVSLAERLRAEQALQAATLRVTQQDMLLAQAQARLQFAQGAQP